MTCEKLPTFWGDFVFKNFKLEEKLRNILADFVSEIFKLEGNFKIQPPHDVVPGYLSIVVATFHFWELLFYS